ncbi:TPA: hypothetical protein ACN5MR_002267 [Salmonella enterica]|nr:hypothetical protein [Salmonella enterica]ECJ2255407.1 hypothetical protein [Salmonella enterica subsp. salamae]
MKKIYLLDRNIISILDRFHEGKALRVDQVNILSYLRSLDRKTNIFSPILAIMEGQSGRLETESEIEKTILDDISKLSEAKFFKQASIDRSFCQHVILKSLLVESLKTSARDLKRDSHIALLEYYNLIIGGKIKTERRKKIAFEMKEKADELNLHLEHPTFFASLLCLFGSDNARRLLKFGAKDFNPYNSYSDIKYFLDSIRVKDLFYRSNLDLVAKIISHDKGIAFLERLYSGPLSTAHRPSAPLVNDFIINLTINVKEVSYEITGKENRNNFCKTFSELYEKNIECL